MSDVRITQWNGDLIERALVRATVRGVDDTTAASAISAKRNHPGWRNRTGTAEGSIRMNPARENGSEVVGEFGSFAVNYFIWLELKHGAALRMAADREFPKVTSRIRGHFN